MNIYVGNLAYSVSEEDLNVLFKEYGEIGSVKIIKDKYSGDSKGFGFVEMPTEADARKAIEGTNGRELKGRALMVNEARPREEKPRGNRGPRSRSW